MVRDWERIPRHIPILVEDMDVASQLDGKHLVFISLKQLASRRQELLAGLGGSLQHKDIIRGRWVVFWVHASAEQKHQVLSAIHAYFTRGRRFAIVKPIVLKNKS